MANLVVLKFDTADGAEKGLELAVSLQKKQLLQIKDAAIVTWPIGKKQPKTRQHPGLASAGALDGAFWGLLFGILFFMPVFGVAIGAAIGALGAQPSGFGIDEDFIRQVRTKVTEGTSGLFLLLGAMTADKVVEAFKQAPHFELIASNLTHEQEQRLKDAFG
jgi:uncharacterized membrane protein